MTGKPPSLPLSSSTHKPTMHKLTMITMHKLTMIAMHKLTMITMTGKKRDSVRRAIEGKDG